MILLCFLTSEHRAELYAKLIEFSHYLIQFNDMNSYSLLNSMLPRFITSTNNLSQDHFTMQDKKEILEELMQVLIDAIKKEKNVRTLVTLGFPLTCNVCAKVRISLVPIVSAEGVLMILPT